MTQVLVVRHAQAAFGTDDYDRLTDLGHRQAGWLGDYFVERSWQFSRVLTGGLRRHRETVAGIAAAGLPLPDALATPGLGEYDPERLIEAYARDETPVAPAVSVDRAAHFRRLRTALLGWCQDEQPATGLTPFASFQDGAWQAFRSTWEGRSRERGERILIVSSGGPITALIARHLGIAPAGFVALNLQIRNTSVAEFRIDRQDQAHLVSFNTVPHLDLAARREAITFS